MFKFKKVKSTRAFVCLLVLFAMLTVWAVAFADGDTVPAPEVPAVETEAAAEPAPDADPEIDVINGIKKIAATTGFAQGTWREYAMIAVACVLLYLAIVKQFEPLLLLPIAFGMLLANLPGAGLMADPVYKTF